ncbi:MAG: hypothetical protein K9W43_02025 [Candidatus Thorarchaeota archaeon]|nr:hypothetical protein [Candidatus Thorarchaeota archaeon]
MYKILLTRRALKDLKKLDIATRRRIAAAIKDYAQEPLFYTRKLIHPKLGM